MANFCKVKNLKSVVTSFMYESLHAKHVPCKMVVKVHVKPPKWRFLKSSHFRRFTVCTIRFWFIKSQKTNISYLIFSAPGGDFQSVLDEDMVPFEEDVQGFLRQILEALDFIHERNIAHLDIKVISSIHLYHEIFEGDIHTL